MKTQEKICHCEEEVLKVIEEAKELENVSVLLSSGVLKTISKEMTVKYTPWGRWSQLVSIGRGENKVYFPQSEDPETIICISYANSGE